PLQSIAGTVDIGSQSTCWRLPWRSGRGSELLLHLARLLPGRVEASLDEPDPSVVADQNHGRAARAPYRMQLEQRHLALVEAGGRGSSLREQGEQRVGRVRIVDDGCKHTARTADLRPLAIRPRVAERMNARD